MFNPQQFVAKNLSFVRYARPVEGQLSNWKSGSVWFLHIIDQTKTQELLKKSNGNFLLIENFLFSLLLQEEGSRFPFLQSLTPEDCSFTEITEQT